MVLGFELGVASTLVVLLGALVTVAVLRNRENSSKRLRASVLKLRALVSELLSRADHLDQESKFVSGGLKPEQSECLTRACEDLVLLGDAVDVIETRIKQKELNLARKDLLISLAAADKISAQMKEIRQEIETRKLNG